MMLRFFSILALLLVAGQPALACRYKPVELADALKGAEKAFVGTVVTVENRLAVIKVEKPVKGVSAGETLDVEIGPSSCAIRFEPGQRWLYLGAEQPSGSLLLRDENGYDVTDSLKFMREKLGDSAPASDTPDTTTIGGTVERSCAPWDGTAYRFLLDNGVIASIYAPLSDLEKTDRKMAAVFPADNRPEHGHGQIVRCPKLKEGETSNIPCQSVEGTIFIGPVDGLTAAGHVDIKEGEHNTRHVFKVKRVQKQVFCG